MSFSIEFDYRFDVENFFTPERRAVLEEAARLWSDLIQDDFDDVEAGHRFAVLDPQSFEFTAITFDKPIDDVLILPSALDFGQDGVWFAGYYDGLGDRTLFEIGPSIGTKFENRLSGTDFEPWLGTLFVDSTTNWSFDDTPEPGEFDFRVAALDMIGNVLGLRTSSAFDALVENGEFSGTNAVSIFGHPIPINDNGFIPPVIEKPFLTPDAPPAPSFEDRIALADIGYEVGGFERVGSVPDLTTAANDIVYGTILADQINGQGGSDRINGAEGDDTLLGGPGNDTLIASSGKDWLDGGANDDALIADDGNDTLLGGAGNDELIDQGGDSLLDGGTGNDTLVSFTADNDTLLGGAGNDDLFVVGGQNILDGGAGNDTFQGGSGQDSFVFGPGSGADLINDFQASQDVLVLENSGFTRARQVLASLEETPDDTQLLTLRDGSTIEMAIIPNADGSLLAGKNIRLVNDEGLQTGSVDADVMRGDGTANLLTSFGGDDTLLGAAGEDTLDGGSGADLLNGGPGSDIIYVDDAGDRVAESRRWDGEDLVISSVDFRMGRSHIENLELTGEARLGAGNGLRNQITGNDADNVLDGGGNVDTLTGGAGDDRYFIRSPGDSAVEAAGGGTDTVLAFRAHKLEANIENLFLQTVRTRDGDPVQGINGIGNDLGNVIVGNPFDNLLSGRGGRDTLKGQGGADTFVFDQAPGAGNADRVVDFDASEGDAIWLRAATFGLERGGLAPGAFRVGDAALDAGDRVIFNEGTGQLWFDADGAGGASQQLVATFLGGAVITAADIEII